MNFRYVTYQKLKERCFILNPGNSFKIVEGDQIYYKTISFNLPKFDVKSKICMLLLILQFNEMLTF